MILCRACRGCRGLTLVFTRGRKNNSFSSIRSSQNQDDQDNPDTFSQLTLTPSGLGHSSTGTCSLPSGQGGSLGLLSYLVPTGSRLLGGNQW